MTAVLVAFLSGLAAGLYTNRRAVTRRTEIIHWTRQHLARYEQAVDAYEHKTERYRRVCRGYQHILAKGPRIP